MFPTNNPAFEMLAEIGIFPNSTAVALMDDDTRRRIMTGDAAMVTQANNGIPQWMLAYVDPQIIQILTAPLRAEKIFTPERRGDTSNGVMQFGVIQHTGHVEPYGDYSEGGSADINVKYPTRQAYNFQTTAKWGDKQIAEYGKARINYHAEKERAAAKAIKNAHNDIWFRGVEGLDNVGILNDPDLPAPIAPTVFGASSAVTWADKATIENGALAIYNDIRALFTDIVTRSKGVVSMDDKMKLCLSNTSSTFLAAKSNYNVSVRESLKESFPNMEIVTASEYSTDSGELVQLIADEVDGVKTGILAYTELERSHGIVRKLSSYEEKKSAGSWGAVIFNPFAVSSMIGV